jgi:hypothetical protein
MIVDYKTGKELLDSWGCKTKEEKLTRACIALMSNLNDLHIESKSQDLEEALEDESIFCSCADAYRMGKEALK